MESQHLCNSNKTNKKKPYGSMIGLVAFNGSIIKDVIILYNDLWMPLN